MEHTILVVDDESTTRRVVTFAMKALGVIVVEAANAEIAFQVTQNRLFDLMLIDINLPDIDGFKLATQLHAMNGLENTPKALIGLLAGENRGKRMIKV